MMEYKGYIGKFVVRLPADLHRQAYTQAKLADKSLNGWVAEVIRSALRERSTTEESPA